MYLRLYTNILGVYVKYKLHSTGIWVFCNVLNIQPFAFEVLFAFFIDFIMFLSCCPCYLSCSLLCDTCTYVLKVCWVGWLYGHIGHIHT